MSNSTRRRTTIQAVMRSSEFKAGFDDYRAGRPMRDNWEGRERSHVGAQQWSYERGRALAAYAYGCGMGNTPLKQGRILCDAMVDLFRVALKERAVL